MDWMELAFNLKALMAVTLVGLVCGAVGALVIGNRMAFFSDALAHCSFAGVTLGMLLSLVARQRALELWLVPVVMVAFGVLVGLAIAWVRESTSLASDTVIGVFFAFAVGFGGMLFRLLRRGSYLNLESFMFGSVLFVEDADLYVLAGLTGAVGLVLAFGYNSLVLTSFNAPLARSRRVQVRLWSYLFIVLLAFIVNLCLRAVGALLINALLVVPAATASNLAVNLRQMFWISIAISVGSGIAGLVASNTVVIPIGTMPNGQPDVLTLEPSGAIVVLNVMAFLLSMLVKYYYNRPRRLAAAVARTDNS